MTDERPGRRGRPELVVSVADLRRHLGSRQEVHRALEAHGLALSEAGVPDGAEISFEGELESVPDGVVLTGRASVPWEGTCRRCLGEVAGTATIEVREVYETHPVEGETWPLDHDHVDLGPLLHDLALLALPLAPLCGPDCRGPAPEAFPATVEGGSGDGGEAGDAERPRDPRWAALDDLDL